ncbi:MAG TPA: hypothetical protein DCP92_14950 [Nitrospiraceae bacterium]|nr:hypothetical protein [Nitrospiraceae bacterium]
MICQGASTPLSSKKPLFIKPRTMDCMDCHNRPSHNFHSPDYAVNMARLTGKIDGTLPAIETVAVKAIAQEYKTSSAAHKEIESSISEFYRLKYPAIYRRKKGIIADSIQAVLAAFKTNIFRK